MLDDVAMLGGVTARTRAYLLALREKDLLPSDVVLLKGNGNADDAEIVELLESASVRIQRVDTNDVNDGAVVQALNLLPQRYVIFSGPGGAIVRKALFATGKKFIHVHPGRLPDYRGSTTIYFSLLAESKIEATALLLDEQIDSGPVIGRAAFDIPDDRRTIDTVYDPKIRADLLVSVLQDYVRRGRFETVDQSACGETYFIVHPVLKHLAILAS